MYLKFLFITIIGISSILSIHSAHGDSQSASSTATQEKPEVKIGRVICGGHLSLAVVEKKYRESLSSFQLKTVQYYRWKDVINDMLSGEAAGAVELIVCILAIKNGIIPPTINLENSALDCVLGYVPDKAGKKEIKTAISNSFGFGGNNSTLVVKGLTTPLLFNQHILSSEFGKRNTIN